MMYFQKCVCFILFMSLFLGSLFALFEGSNLKMIKIKKMQQNKTIGIISESYSIENNSSVLNTSLNVKHGTNRIIRNNDSDSNVSYKINDFLREQARRQRHVHASCKQLEIRSSHPKLLRHSLLNLFADRQHHLTFCPVYKSASTSWLITLLQLNDRWNGVGELPRLQSILKKTFSGIYKFDDEALSESSNRFIVVRHPFERLVSCYRDKFEFAKKGYYYRKYGENMVKSYRVISKLQRNNKNTLSKNVILYRDSKAFKVDTELPESLKYNPYANPIGPTFAEFTSSVLDSTHEDEHWKPMYKYCSLCRIDYNFILKFENLYSESQTFIDHLKYTSVLKTRWDNPTKGGSTSGDRTCEYFKQISIDAVKRLIEKYNNDLLLFQYLPDKYIECAKK
ncbi:unnamed protein product, partial [Meganyctiphanes norvegica]|uniref:Carbohydrate sulfotransferase n=1 Tax=Meganyctiphanes norvegica TaxID=48144 RepID=A0AAV2SCT0_MEGNR